MSREKEIQDELDKYWGQLDRVERMLKWLVIRLNAESAINAGFHYTNKEKAKRFLEAGKHLAADLPDISDILEGK